MQAKITYLPQHNPHPHITHIQLDVDASLLVHVSPTPQDLSLLLHSPITPSELLSHPVVCGALDCLGQLVCAYVAADGTSSEEEDDGEQWEIEDGGEMVELTVEGVVERFAFVMRSDRAGERERRILCVRCAGVETGVLECTAWYFGEPVARFEDLKDESGEDDDDDDDDDDVLPESRWVEGNGQGGKQRDGVVDGNVDGSRVLMADIQEVGRRFAEARKLGSGEEEELKKLDAITCELEAEVKELHARHLELAAAAEAQRARFELTVIKELGALSEDVINMDNAELRARLKRGGTIEVEETDTGIGDAEDLANERGGYSADLIDWGSEAMQGIDKTGPESALVSGASEIRDGEDRMELSVGGDVDRRVMDKRQGMENGVNVIGGDKGEEMGEGGRAMGAMDGYPGGDAQDSGADKSGRLSKRMSGIGLKDAASGNGSTAWNMRERDWKNGGVDESGVVIGNLAETDSEDGEAERRIW